MTSNLVEIIISRCEHDIYRVFMCKLTPSNLYKHAKEFILQIQCYYRHLGLINYVV